MKAFGHGSHWDCPRPCCACFSIAVRLLVDSSFFSSTDWSSKDLILFAFVDIVKIAMNVRIKSQDDQIIELQQSEIIFT